ncbi:MAG: helix-turn-helix transcriptional regulator [Bacteroidetes bacterium]|nr:helix-turn-helix transcriptional regulator [Bacteroidota bacterium]
MTARQCEAIRNSLIMIMVSTHLSQRQIARLIGVSYETINRIFRFEDTMISTRMWKKVQNAIKRHK